MSENKQKENVTEQLSSWLTEMAEGELSDTKDIFQIDETNIRIKNQGYQVAENYHDGFEMEEFKERYQPYFEKFEFIVGDWGHEKLRLRGFYQLNKRNVPQNQTIDLLDDYLKEYCNFGCRYFVLAKDEAVDKFMALRDKRQNKTPKEKNDYKETPKSTISTREKQKTNRKKPNKSTGAKNKSDFKFKNADNPQSIATPNEAKQVKKTKKKNFVIKKKTTEK